MKGTPSGSKDDKGRVSMAADNSNDDGSDILNKGDGGVLLLEDNTTLKAAASLKWPKELNLLKEDVGGANCGWKIGGVKNPSRVL